MYLRNNICIHNFEHLQTSTKYIFYQKNMVELMKFIF